MRVLSGIQPSGKLHIGNYFGAMRQYLELQNKGHECFYFIANYHAMTSVHDGPALAEFTHEVARGYLAIGIDPAKASFFRQSDVPEVCELAWIFSTICPMGLLQRCTSYKDKIAQGAAPNHGLFYYPLLMAADILIYESNLVPVGQDQKQHLEVTRDIAGKFNAAFGEILTVPDPYILDLTAVVPGLDGRKMSKSYHNTIELFESAKSLKKKVMSIVTNSTPVEEPKNPDVCTVYALLKLVCTEEEIAEWNRRYRQGGMGYGEAKKRLAELLENLLGPYREKYERLAHDKDYVEDVLREGAAKARAAARVLMEKVRRAAGIVIARNS